MFISLNNTLINNRLNIYYTYNLERLISKYSDQLTNNSTQILTLNRNIKSLLFWSTL